MTPQTQEQGLQRCRDLTLSPPHNLCIADAKTLSLDSYITEILSSSKETLLLL